MLLELLSLGPKLLGLVLVRRDEQLLASCLIQILIHHGGFLRFLATSCIFVIFVLLFTAMWNVFTVIGSLVFLNYSVKIMLNSLYLAMLIQLFDHFL